MDGSDVLRPLDEAAGSIRRLDEYRSPDELHDAVASVAAAAEHALRRALRADARASDHDRLAALSPEALPLDDVVRSLRARNRIAIETAGDLHELAAAAARAADGQARAADADIAHRVVARLRAELGAMAAEAPPPGDRSPSPDRLPPPGDRSPPPADGPASAASGASGASPQSAESAASRPPPPRVRGGGRWMAWVGAAFALLMMVGLAWVLAGGGTDHFETGEAAFRAARWDSAAAAFERALEDRPVDVTTMLYLARSYRRQERLREAADVLREAARVAPDDAAVRRELGHLFMDLGQPASAVQQYERALEQDPASVVTWTRLIDAMRAAGDDRADRVLERAPAEARSALEGR